MSLKLASVYQCC